MKEASKELPDNKDIMIAAVKNKGFALQYISDELKGEFDMVMAAVGKCGYAL